MLRYRRMKCVVVVVSCVHLLAVFLNSARSEETFWYTISDGKQTSPTWKLTNPELEDAPTTWDMIIGLAETGSVDRAWQVFNEKVAPTLKDSKSLLGAKTAICSSAGDTTGALSYTLQAMEIRKGENRGKEDEWRIEVSEYDYQVDGQMFLFYYPRRM